MAISAYIGVPGSGKSYEVVASVIIPACLAGRRIVTNIYGISADKIVDYCVRVKKADRTSLGHIIHVENEQVQQETFFPYKTAQSAFCGNTCCQPGDLICIDEAWRIWPAEKKIPLNHQSFIAEHVTIDHLTTKEVLSFILSERLHLLHTTFEREKATSSSSS